MMLSICIPTLPEPRSQQHLANLMALLSPQLSDQVEVLTDTRERNVPTGTKRTALYSQAKGKYVCSVDCDDWIAPNYVAEILEAAKVGPDVITFEGWYTENGRNHVDWTIRLGEKYEARHENGKYMFFRFPNHLVPMKRELATRVKFPDKWQGEDYEWALKIRDMGLLKSEVHIFKQLYHYQYITNK